MTLRSTAKMSSSMDVTNRSISSLKPHPGNPRTHTKKQIRQIADSIRQFGWTNPILIDGTGRIIAGHGRVEAAKLLGLDTVPTIQLEHLSEDEIRAYVIADNRLAELAGWDREILAIELQLLTMVDISFDVTITGFETAEIDLLIEGLDAGEPDDTADQIPAYDESQPPVSRHGDLWQLGHHRLLCDDATKPESYTRLSTAEQNWSTGRRKIGPLGA